MFGLIGALTLLVVLTMRGMNLFIATPLCALLVALSSGLALSPQSAAEGAPNLITAYMGGFTGFIANWFFMFLLGSIFGKLMEDSGAADSVSRWVTARLGMKRAALAVVAACAILTYGGVSLFVVAFSVYPMALALFREADLPRRFIPAALAFGSVTFTMTSAGSPEIQNWIPIQYLGTTPYAAWEASAIVAIAMATFGYWWLKRMLARAKARGERFEARKDDPVSTRTDLPHPALSTIPLAVVLAVSYMVTHLPGSPLISAAIAVSLIAAMTGSASGGQAIALPILAPHFLAQGVNPDQLHRVVAISSGVLDSLPHNGYVVTTIRAICGETHQAAYAPMAAMTVVVPLLGLVLCIALFAIGL